MGEIKNLILEKEALLRENKKLRRQIDLMINYHLCSGQCPLGKFKLIDKSGKDIV